jgi:hypothetical protein
MRKITLILCIITFLGTVSAQRRSKNRPYWSTHFMLSSSTFLSDLGGKNFYGSNDPTDIDFKKIRYAFGTGIEYNLPKGISFGIDAFYTRLIADDKETDWDRKYRKLKVRTDLFESSIKLQYTVPQNMGPLGGLYFNVGTGVAFFKPMSELNGVWYSLRPFGTEGQLLEAPFQPYDNYSIVFPFGVGKKFYLRNGMTLAIDLSMRKSFTDYLDDVSGLYYDNDAILAKSGVAAAYFADPSGGEGGVGTPGEERGFSTNNDNYFLTGFKLGIPLNGVLGGNMHNSCSYNNSWINSDGSIPRFRKKGRRKRLRRFR